VGKMPLQVELVDAEGKVIDKIAKRSDGQIEKNHD